jgi:hypothetical protein
MYTDVGVVVLLRMPRAPGLEAMYLVLAAVWHSGTGKRSRVQGWLGDARRGRVVSTRALIICQTHNEPLTSAG